MEISFNSNRIKHCFLINLPSITWPIKSNAVPRNTCSCVLVDSNTWSNANDFWNGAMVITLPQVVTVSLTCSVGWTLKAKNKYSKILSIKVRNLFKTNKSQGLQYFFVIPTNLDAMLLLLLSLFCWRSGFYGCCWGHSFCSSCNIFNWLFILFIVDYCVVVMTT